MSAKLGQIPAQNFETIRDKIGVILALEIPNQTAINNVGVWLERNIPFGSEELPAINVMFDSSDYDNHDPKSRRAENQYYIDVVVNAPHTTSQSGDKTSNLLAQRIAGIVMYILSSAAYRTLDFEPGLIQSRWVSEVRIGRSQEGDSLHTIVARITFKVRASETVENLTGVLGTVWTSQIKLDETDKGFLIKNE